MSPEFDPYREWLGIKNPQRPLNYYQLLDLKLYESDRQRIENAEMIQMAKVLRHESGPHAELAASLNRELETAIRCLLDPTDKAAYDAELFMSPHAPQPASGDFQVAAEIDQPTESIEEETPVEEPVTQAIGSHDFAADLRLDEDEEEEEKPDEFSADLRLPDEEPEAEAEPVTRHAVAAAIDGEEEANHRPSLMEILEQPAKGKPAAKAKEAASTKKSASQSYDPPPIPKKPLLPALPQLPNASGKPIAAVAAVVALALAVWYAPAWLPRSAPSAAKVLAKIEDPDPQTRIDGIDSLWALEMPPHEAAALLVKVLKEDQTDSVRVAAAGALVNTGSPTPDVSAELKTLLEKEQNANVKAMLEWLVSQAGGR
jgi:hypothetical protein